jgi:peptide/nickel transport system substrate-binding protein
MRAAHTAAIMWLVLALALTACSQAGRPQAAPGSAAQGTAGEPASPARAKRISVATAGEPPTLNSTVAASQADTSVRGRAEVESLVHVGLAAQDDRGMLTPRLAVQVPAIENGLWKVLPDGRMETMWQIKPNVKWHDGTPFTADDLVFTARVAQDADLPLTRDVAYDSLESLVAVDAQTVVIRWKSPYIGADLLFTQRLGLPIAKHLVERTYSENKSTLPQLAYWTQEFVGTGPYKLREWVQGSHLVLEASSDYILGRPKLDEIEVKFIPDPSTRMANILAGATDMTFGLGLSLNQGLQLRDQWRDGRLAVSLGGSRALHPQLLNPSPAILTDARYRRALIHGLDRQEMVDTLQAGLSQVPHSFLNPSEPEYAETLESAVRYEFDPRPAVEMISGLGYARESDGWFYDATRQKLDIEISSVITGDDNEKAMLSVADYWQRIGITVVTAPIPIQRQRDREFRATIRGFDLAGGGGGDIEYLQRLRRSQVPLPENNFVGLNKTRYSNPEFDGTIDRFFTTIARPERIQVLRQIVHHISDQVVIIPMFYTAQPTMIANRLDRVSDTLATSSVITWNAQEWDFR